ncbi:MAG: M48 family metallopeptidase [Limisphaerales bacterium]
MQFDFQFASLIRRVKAKKPFEKFLHRKVQAGKLGRPKPFGAETLSVNGREIPLAIVHNRRARRYVLRLRPDGSARVTVPRSGSISEARQFAERQIPWLQRQLNVLSACPRQTRKWSIGTKILFHGEFVTIAAGDGEWIQFGSESCRALNSPGDLRPAIEKHMRTLAQTELPARALEFASQHQLSITRISVRNQKSRWGSCSPRGAISLNWRLLQTPPFVRDYIILHELMHLRQMNHSEKFWREVRDVCPDYHDAKRWLKENPGLLR